MKYYVQGKLTRSLEVQKVVQCILLTKKSSCNIISADSIYESIEIKNDTTKHKIILYTYV